MNLTCMFFSHDTAIDTSGEQGVIWCRRCGVVTDHWRIVRPERFAREVLEAEQRAKQVRDQAIVKERERRVLEMAKTQRAKILRIQR